MLASTVTPVLMTFAYRKYFGSENPGNIEWHNPLHEWIE